jgi:flagellar hook-associated protein 3 FlgL
LSNVSDITAQVGGRLNAITTQQSVATGQQTQLQSSISTLQGLDYPAAVTTLDQENTTLSAALQAYSLTQGLSLFKYIE